VTNIVPITAAPMRADGPPMRRLTQKTSYGPGISSQVHRRYYGKVLVVVEAGIQHGFVFEPGSVVLDYVAADGSHPRDPREMVMTITGSGRMAAAHELAGSVHDGGEQESRLQLPKGQHEVEGEHPEDDEQ
jgi:hypothetical protein